MTLIEQEDIRKNQEAYLKRIERYMEQMVQNPAKLGEREGNISLRATEDDSKNNEKAAELKGKTVMENKEKPTLVELSEFDLRYKAQIAIKSQYLADFIVEDTKSQRSPMTWNLCVDGSSNKAGNGAGVILESDQETWIELLLRFEFPASNNQAEYEALLAGLKLAKKVGTKKLIVFSNSQVITSQINGTYQVKDPNMKRYLEEARKHLSML
nr:uncharacterized protein LOC112748506 [Arachis hypogaea]